MLKPLVISQGKDSEEFNKMINTSLSNSSCEILDCNLQDNGICFINNVPKNDLIIADIITDKNDNIIRLESTLGNIDAKDLSETSKKTLKEYANKRKSNELDINSVAGIKKEPSNNNNNEEEGETNNLIDDFIKVLCVFTFFPGFKTFSGRILITFCV